MDIIIELEKVDRDSNCRRKYQMVWSGIHHQLLVRWGRIGEAYRQKRVYEYRNERELRKESRRLLNRRLAHGYEVSRCYGQMDELRVMLGNRVWSGGEQVGLFTVV